MTVPELILWLFIGTPEERHRWHLRWQHFCEKHLVADDPADRPRPEGEDDENGED